MTVTQTPNAPLVVVVAATSRQGSSVINRLIESDQQYRIRGFTSDAKRPAALEFAKKGVDIVETSLTVKDADTLLKALEGATFFFAVTDFWSHLDMNREIAEGKMFVDAAKTANVKLLLWSSLPNATKLSGSKYLNCYHLDSKAIVSDHAKIVGVPFVEVQCGWYDENFLNLGMISKQADGTFILETPTGLETNYPMINTSSDMGLFVRRAIENPLPVGTVIPAFGELINGAAVLEQFEEVTGKKLHFKQISQEECKRRLTAPVGKLPAINANEILEMFLVIEEFEYYGTKNPVVLEGLAAKPKTWIDYVKKTNWEEL